MAAELLAGAAALLLYPGALVAALLGMAAEVAAGWALIPGRGVAVAFPATVSAVRGAFPRPPAIPGAAALLALLAATQVAAPFSPLPATERNTVVAIASLMGASWLGWAWGWGRRRADPGLALLVQACWLLSVLLPSIAPENLRPQVLGGVSVPALLPLKLASAVLYVGCLPALLQAIPETAPQGIPGERRQRSGVPEEAAFTAVRALLWMPYCGLFASLFFAAPADDLLGVLRFALLLAGVITVSVVLAGYLVRRPDGASRVYRRLGLPFAGFSILVAVLTAVTQ